VILVLLLLSGIILLLVCCTTLLAFGRLGLLAVSRVCSSLGRSRGGLSRSPLLCTRRTSLFGLGGSWLDRCLLLASAFGFGRALGLGLCVAVLFVVRCVAVVWAFLDNVDFVCLLGDLLATLRKRKSRLGLTTGLLYGVASLCSNLDVAVLDFIDSGFRVSSTPWPRNCKRTR